MSKTSDLDTRMGAVPQPGPDEAYCPVRACFGGVLVGPCAPCAGKGEVYDAETRAVETCEACGGAGEEPLGDCAACGGRGIVRYAVAKLYEADRYICANSPDWLGDDADARGVTLYSLAKWWRQRSFLGAAVKAAQGELRPMDDDSVLPGDRTPTEAVVELLDAQGKVLTTFHGFAWGYGGEGPTGLAAVLADALPQRFPTFEQARNFVMAQRQDTWRA